MTAAEEKQYYTIEEANKRLPLVRLILQDIVELYKEVHERRERLTRIRQRPGVRTAEETTLYDEEVEQIQQELDTDINRLEGYVDELKETGAELKDPLIGLVDFPTIMNGREVSLCWKLGEAEIGYWHELDAGYQGRQPLYENSVPHNPVDKP